MATKVLIVDDEPDILRMLGSRLERNGYEVSIARDGEECLKRADDVKPDCIVLDIAMPNMSGTEAAQKLKENPATQKIPIIFLTALQTKAEEDEKGPSVGGNRIFAKPFDPQRLLDEINRSVREKLVE